MDEEAETWIELAALTRNVVWLMLEKSGTALLAAAPQLTGTEGGSRPCTGSEKVVTDIGPGAGFTSATLKSGENATDKTKFLWIIAAPAEARVQ